MGFAKRKKLSEILGKSFKSDLGKSWYGQKVYFESYLKVIARMKNWMNRTCAKRILSGRVENNMLNRSNRCWVRMLQTKLISDKFEKLMIILNIAYLYWRFWFKTSCQYNRTSHQYNDFVIILTLSPSTSH